MTTPLTGIITVPVTSAPQRFSSGLGGQILLINLDETNEIWVSYSQVPAGDSSAVNVPPLGNITMTDKAPMWAVADQGVTGAVQMSVVPGGGTFAASPVQIATQLLPLAVDIAEQIAATGVSLLGAPVPLYSLPSAPLSGSGPVGATVFPDGYGLTDYIAAANLFDGYLGNRRLALTCQKWYLGAGSFILTSAQIPAGLLELINAGVQIYLSIKPSQSLTTTDYNNVTTTINVLKAAGASNIQVILWQEPNGHNSNGTPFFPSAAAYIAYVNYYIGAVRAAGVSGIVYDPVVYVAETAYTFYPGDANTVAVICDYYGDSYNQGTRLDVPFGGAAGSMMSLADNHLPSPVPFGIGEWGVSADNVAHPVGLWNAYWAYLLNLFTTRIDNGKTNAPIMWYSGHNVNGTNILPDGPGYDLTAGIDALYNAVSSSSSIVTIAAGATITAPALMPSAGAGYAPCTALSYEISVNLTAGAGSTVPFAAVEALFYDTDSPSALPIDAEQWLLPMGASNTTGTVIMGRGPQRGAYMAIQVTNLDTVACELGMQLNSSSRTSTDDDWEWDAHSVAMPLSGTYTPCGGPSFANSLGTIGGGTPVTVAAGATTTRILSMWAGQVYLRWGVTATTPADCGLTLTPLPQSQWGSATLYNVTGGDNTYVTLPRCPCLVTLYNNQSTGSATFFANFMVQRMAQ